MRYTINAGPNAGKRINVPDDFIDRSMRAYDMTREDAVNMYLEDEGYMENEIVMELTTKAKETGAVDHKARADRKPRKAPERKPDEIKRAIVAALAEFLAQEPANKNITVTNIERMVAFEAFGDNYEITLTKKRKPKE